VSVVKSNVCRQLPPYETQALRTSRNSKVGALGGRGLKHTLLPRATSDISRASTQPRCSSLQNGRVYRSSVRAPSQLEGRDGEAHRHDAPLDRARRACKRVALLLPRDGVQEDDVAVVVVAADAQLQEELSPTDESRLERVLHTGPPVNRLTTGTTRRHAWPSWHRATAQRRHNRRQETRMR